MRAENYLFTPVAPHNSQQSSDSDFAISMPIVFYSPPPPPPAGTSKKSLYCSNSTLDIPDNDPIGVSSTVSINDPRFIADLDVRLDIDHTFVGDLIITLRHEGSGNVIDLINRPGIPGTDNRGCKLNNIKAILDDEVSLPV